MRARLVEGSLLVALVLALFGRAIAAPFVEWDDARYLLGNPLVNGDGVVNMIDYLFTPQLFYIVPFTVAVERGLYVLGGGAAWPFHALSVLLHATSAVLLWQLALTLGASRRAAWWAAALYAVHPMVVEPVVWATGLKDVLATSLALGMALAFAQHRPRLATLLGVLACLSKPTALLLPFALVLLAPARWRTLVPLWIMTIVIGGLSALMRLDAVPVATGQVAHVDALTVLALQIEHYVAPIALQPIYFVAWNVPSIALGIVAVALCAIALLRLRGPAHFALAWAVLAYLPSSQLIPFQRPLADSFLTLPATGIWLGLAIVLTARPARRVWSVVALATLLTWSAITWKQVARWRSTDALWRPAIADDLRWNYPWVLLAQGYQFEHRGRDAAWAYGQLFARQYAAQYLSAYATALAAVNDPDAGCVFLEDRAFGPDAARADRNLARYFGAVHPPLPTTKQSCAPLRRALERISLP